MKSRNILCGGAAGAFLFFIASTAIAGVAPSIAVFADFDGDGITDVGVYSTADGNWFLNESTDGLQIVPNFGGPNFAPVPADYDGDGKADVSVYDVTTGNWFMQQTTGGLVTIPTFGGGA